MKGTESTLGEEPLISIIIPTCDRPHDLQRCVAALVSGGFDPKTMEIVVCNDGQHAETNPAIGPMAKWYQGERKGPATNRNLGARKAKGKWLVFIDDDCVPRPQLLPAYQRAFDLSSGSNPVLEGSTYSGVAKESLLWEAPSNPDGGMLISCNFAIPRALFQELGGFDMRFPMAAFEDTEFHARMCALGIPTQFIAEAAVDHPLRRLPGPLRLSRRWEARVIYAFDLRATSFDVLWRLPLHVAKVIPTRFWNRPLGWANTVALFYFVAEFFLMLFQLPFWIAKYRLGERSAFWKQRLGDHTLPRNFGF